MRKYIVVFFLLVFLSLMAIIVYMANIQSSEIVNDSIEIIDRSGEEFIQKEETPIQDIEEEKNTKKKKKKYCGF